MLPWTVDETTNKVKVQDNKHEFEEPVHFEHLMESFETEWPGG